MTTILAPNYTSGRPRIPNVIVLHTTENAQGTPAANVARYFQNSGVKASIHVIIDDQDIVRCVPDGDTAWHAATANPWTLGIEQVGKASQTSEWSNDYALRQRALVKRQLNEWSSTYGIRLVRLSNEELFAAATNPDITGVVGHVQVTEVFPHGNDGHWDPGPNYPWDILLNQQRESGQEMFYIRNTATGEIWATDGQYRYPQANKAWQYLEKAPGFPGYNQLDATAFAQFLASIPVAPSVTQQPVDVNALARAVVVELGRK